MNAWEMDLATRSTDRVVRPFDWGLDWTADWPFQSSASRIPETRIRELNRHRARRAARSSSTIVPPTDFRIENPGFASPPQLTPRIP